MSWRVLLASGGIRTPERVSLFVESLRQVFGEANRVLLIHYAGDDGTIIRQSIEDRGLDGGYYLNPIDTFSDPRAAVEEAGAFYVPGGNTFRLLDALYHHGLLEPIRRRVLRDGVPYVGTSAGSNVACPTIQTTNDMPVVIPPRLDALGLVPFQINPHYYEGRAFIETSGRLEAHYGETRDERLAEFLQHNAIPVVGLREGSLLRCEPSSVRLVGEAARIFRPGAAPMEVHPGTNLAPFIYLSA